MLMAKIKWFIPVFINNLPTQKKYLIILPGPLNSYYLSIISLGDGAMEICCASGKVLFLFAILGKVKPAVHYRCG